uniref:Uncharacterized protein n=1 Tax=Arundo donax TaxID=35708 RepID=A0A0A9F2J1_ARUDO
MENKLFLEVSVNKQSLSVFTCVTDHSSVLCFANCNAVRWWLSYRLSFHGCTSKPKSWLAEGNHLVK